MLSFGATIAVSNRILGSFVLCWIIFLAKRKKCKLSRNTFFQLSCKTYLHQLFSNDPTPCDYCILSLQQVQWWQTHCRKIYRGHQVAKRIEVFSSQTGTVNAQDWGSDTALHGVLNRCNKHWLLFLGHEILILTLPCHVNIHWNDISVPTGTGCAEKKD